MSKPSVETIIFDLGGVLIDWNPEYVFRHIFPNEEQMRYFFENICTNEWNVQQDAGRSIEEATTEKVAEFPEYEEEIRAYYGRWKEMLGGPIQDSVEILKQLKTQGSHRLYALTNWSHETFPVALGLYDFLHWFDGIVVSGEEKTRKPFSDIYHILLNRYQVEPSTAIFIDDSLKNVAGAEAVGIRGIHFQSPSGLTDSFRELGITGF